jgi:hypothetical protein
MAQAPLAEDPLASPTTLVWLPWYFRQRWLSILTVPLFFLLVYGACGSAVGGFILLLAFVRSTGAVFGRGWAYLAATFGWIPAALPAALYYSLLKNIPGTWLRRDVKAGVAAKLGLTLGVLVLFVGLSELFFIYAPKGIAWIADRNPCASAPAGVTGNIVPFEAGCH